MIKRAIYRVEVMGARLLLRMLQAIGFFRFPRTVRLESTDICNANCRTCTREMMTRSMGVMDMELFKKLADECAERGVNSLHLHNFGEPLLDKFIIEKIRYATSKGLRTRFFSNLSLLTEESARELVLSGLSRIKISIDGNTKETFDRIRRGLDFDKVTGNIELLLRTRKALGKNTPEVGLIYVETEDNKGETAGFLRRWQGCVDSIDVSSYHNWAGDLDGGKGIKERLLPCLRVWQTFTVLWNGDVSLCCMDYDGKVILGNVRDNTIAEVYKGEALRKIQELHLRGDFGKLPICLNCAARR